MNIELRFDYYSQIIFIPDEYIKNFDTLQVSFLEWVKEQPDCIIKGPDSSLALSYDENDFVKYVNDVLLKDSREKSYLLRQTKHVKVNRIIKF